MSDRHQTKPYPLRMPEELRERLKEAAHSNHRSLNAEIVARLQSTFEGIRPFGQVLNEGNTEEEANALRARFDALNAAITTLLGEQQALESSFKRIRHAERESQKAEQDESSSDKQDDSD